MAVADLNYLLSRTFPWQAKKQETPAVALFSQIRLCRNVCNVRFPSTAAQNDLEKLRDKIVGSACMLPKFDKGVAFVLSSLSENDRSALCDRLILPLDAPQTSACAVMASRDGGSVLQINLEDHLNLQIFRPGLALKTAWREADRHDALLSREFEFAYKAELGFLTASPENVGTGLRATVALHIPGIVLAGQLQPVMNALDALRFRVRNIRNERCVEITGNTILVSNQSCIGASEKEIIQRLEAQTEELIQLELRARQLVLETQPELLFDFVSRAYATMRNAFSVSYQEFTELLSAVRLGIDCGMFSVLDNACMQPYLWMLTPGHVCRALGAKPSEYNENVYRASILRKRMV